jgi:hypothetical protein
MSIASASLVPSLAVNGLQFLNPALASSSLSTDAGGNVISGGSYQTPTPTIGTDALTGNPGDVINSTLLQSRCEFAQNGKFVDVISSITFQLNSLPASGNNNYFFTVPNLPLVQQFFPGSTVVIPYGYFFNLINNTGGTSVIGTANIQISPNQAQTASVIALNEIDMSGFSTTTTFTLTIAGSYFAQ